MTGVVCGALERSIAGYKWSQEGNWRGGILKEGEDRSKYANGGRMYRGETEYHWADRENVMESS